MIWWNNELQEFHRTTLRASGINGVIDALVTRFRPDPAQVTVKFNAEIRLEENG